jgi:glycine betaine/proline transport system ATP-binding protein
MDEDSYLKVSGLWKIFGRDPKRVLSHKFKEKSKEEIHKETGCVVGLRDIHLEIKKGEFYILMGLSGSGKSTLIRNLIRLVKPSSGTISVDGLNVTKMSHEELLDFRRNKIGMVFQHYGLMPHFTVLDNAAYGLKVKGMPRGERYAKAMTALETVGLKGWEDYYPTSLSGGMQQRVGLARALANDPEILLMDEPFSGLDPLIRRQMQDELIELQSKLKKTIVFVTHDLHEALKLGDRIAIMRNGEVVQIGTPEDIVTNPATDYVTEFVRDASPAKVLTAGSIMENPKVLLYKWEGPKTALTILNTSKKKAAIVVDRGDRLIGLVRESKLSKLLESGEKYSTIPKEIIENIESCNKDDVIETLFALASRNKSPIPVVGENNTLLGVVTTDSIFESITPNEGGQNV